MKPLLAAIRFLTPLPLPGTWGTAEADLARSVPYFPVVGLLLGALAAGVAWSVRGAPPLVAAAVLVLLMLGFSGCLHIDGLADTADGLLSSRNRQRMLEIMRDSRVGTMGVVAVVAVFVLKFAALASLPSGKLLAAALLMPLAGRCTMVVHIALLPYARPDGVGAIFTKTGHRTAAVWAVAVLALASYAMLGPRGLVLWAVCIAATLLLAAYFRSKLGGATGDTFGAVCELLEVVPALTLALGVSP